MSNEQRWTGDDFWPFVCYRDWISFSDTQGRISPTLPRPYRLELFSGEFPPALARYRKHGKPVLELIIGRAKGQAEEVSIVDLPALSSPRGNMEEQEWILNLNRSIQQAIDDIRQLYAFSYWLMPDGARKSGGEVNDERLATLLSFKRRPWWQRFF